MTNQTTSQVSFWWCYFSHWLHISIRDVGFLELLLVGRLSFHQKVWLNDFSSQDATDFHTDFHDLDFKDLQTTSATTKAIVNVSLSKMVTSKKSFMVTRCLSIQNEPAKTHSFPSNTSLSLSLLLLKIFRHSQIVKVTRFVLPSHKQWKHNIETSKPENMKPSWCWLLNTITDITDYKGFVGYPEASPYIHRIAILGDLVQLVQVQKSKAASESNSYWELNLVNDHPTCRKPCK